VPLRADPEERRHAQAGARSQHHLVAERIAARAAQASGQPRFSLTAYTGRSIRQSWSRNPIVVDLAGMDTKTNVVSIMYGHQYDISAALGQADAIDNSMEDLALAGNLICEGEIYDRVVSYAKKGWRFQASIGADVNRIEKVAAG
jgi:hypothetical protein